MDLGARRRTARLEAKQPQVIIELHFYILVRNEMKDLKVVQVSLSKKRSDGMGASRAPVVNSYE